MESETRSAVRIFSLLVAGVLVVIGWWSWRQATRPHLEAVRVVFRGGDEAVASDAWRVFPAGTPVELYAVVTYRRGTGAPRHLCPHAAVEVGGQRLEVEPLAAWPASGGELRASWYTVEPSLLGWQDIGPETADKLAYRDFLAPELGRELAARFDFAARNDDFLARTVAGNAMPGGTFRIKVRVGSYRTADSLLPQEAVGSPGAEVVFSGAVPAFVVHAPLPAGLAAALSPLLRLGCFTFRPGVWEGGEGWPLPLPPSRLAAAGYITTPEHFAAAAAGGVGWGAPVVLEATASGWRRRGGDLLRWGVDVAAGDALRRNGRYAVLLADDGDGLLSLADEAIFAWGEPARLAPVAMALGSVDGAVELLPKAR